ncbi:MAG: ABC transporter ATP-binding protein [Rhizobium sp.]|nr:ABC transporter ATP-binding protein [Rhizobium sp.]
MSTLLSIKDMSVNFGGVKAVQNVDLDIPQGMIWGLMGPNGAGKTTLVNMVSGLIKPSSGSMTFDGKVDGPWPISRSVRLGIVRTFQQTRAFMDLTIRENLKIAEVASRQSGDLPLLIETFGLEGVLDRVASTMPYPVLRRLGIALALASRPKLLLLDEPAVGLTADELSRMGEIIREWNRRGVTILLIEHNVRFLMSLAGRISVLDRGKLLFEGTPTECRGNSAVIDAYLGRRYSDD